jgi:hypothetical protein
MLAPNGPWADAVAANARAKKQLAIMALTIIFMVFLSDARREE